ncbi:LuxR C-terminal-related transcriptional regulator [Streptomyces vinaceus]|uniref:helix-turn-helix transcriptional regulator n=1 Tax=Streptomyces vinaceus TaxID=1960 RepID=UPI0035E005AB
MTTGRLPQSALPWARPLIGRSAQIRAFESALADGRVRGAVIHGASGSGTSRLADHLVRLAEERRHPTLRLTLSPTVPRFGQDALPPARGEAVPRLRTVVLVDELQYVDTADAALLSSRLARGDLFLLATVREDEVRPSFVVDLARRDDIAHIHLAPLDTDGTAVLLRGLLGSDVDSGTLRMLDRLALGNVRTLTELVEGLHQAGHLHHDGHLWRATGPVVLTPRLAVLIEDRLDQAGPRARGILETLALAGTVGVADLTESGDTSALPALEERGLVETRLSGRRATVRLAHPLFSEVLLRRIPALRRRDLLRRQAARIQRHGGRRTDDLLTSVRLRAAAGHAEPALLVEAAHAARRRNDHTAVLSLLDALPARHGTPATELLRAEALYHRGDWQAADARLRALARSGDRGAVVSAVVVAMANLFWSGAPTSEILRLARQTRPLMASEEERRSLDETAAGVLLLSGHPGLALARLESLAGLPGSSHSRLLANSMRILGMIADGRAEDALEGTQTMRQELVRGTARGTASPIFHPSVFGVLDVAALTELGRLEEAEAGAREQAATGASNPLRDTWLAFRRGRCAWVSGRAADARLHYADAIALSEKAGYTRVLRVAYSGLAASLAVLGEHTAAARAAAASATHPRMGLLAGEDLLGAAWLHAVEGRLADARAVLETACRDARAAGQKTSHMLLLTDLVRLGAHHHAAPLRELAQQCQGPLAQARAAYARAAADRDPHALVEAARALAGLGAHAVAADASSHAAQLFHQAHQPHRARRADLLTVQEQQHLQGARPLPRPALLAHGEHLTPREHEVAQRAAGRLTSKEIAAELVVSVRTVDNTLQRIYRKLGVTNRRELAHVLQVPRP